MCDAEYDRAANTVVLCDAEYDSGANTVFLRDAEYDTERQTLSSLCDAKCDRGKLHSAYLKRGRDGCPGVEFDGAVSFELRRERTFLLNCIRDQNTVLPLKF